MRLQGSNIDQTSSKNRSRNEGMMGIALGIDFSWIFVDFWRQVGGKLASKIDENTAQKSVKKRWLAKGIWRRLGGVLEPS